jgi:hypothetical protein
MPRGRPPKPVTQQPPATEEEVLSGLYVFGTVIDRTRRTINTRKNDSTAEIVTYTIQDNTGRRYYVDEYSPEEYFDLNEYAEIPVYVKTFKKRTGDIGYSFCVQQEFASIRGERF